MNGNEHDQTRTRPEAEVQPSETELREAAASAAQAEQRPAGADGAEGEPYAEVAELKDRLLRTLAEMENLRRRTQREIEETRKFAVTGFARDLLDVGDNLGRALASVPVEAREGSEFMKNLVLGVEMTQRSLMGALEKHQVRRVEPQRGDRFDHKLHQAMFEVPSADLAPGAVAEVIQAGYVIADRLLRPALVGVAKAAPQAADEPSSAPTGARANSLA